MPPEGSFFVVPANNYVWCHISFHLAVRNHRIEIVVTVSRSGTTRLLLCEMKFWTESIPERQTMPYDPGLAERLEEVLEGRPGFEQKKMFGGIGWMLNGNMCVGVYEETVAAKSASWTVFRKGVSARRLLGLAWNTLLPERRDLMRHSGGRDEGCAKATWFAAAALWKNHYSYRRATIGSTFIARRAGM